MSQEKRYAQRFKPTKRGGSFYLRIPRQLMNELKISEDDESEIVYDESTRRICYNFGSIKKR